jgi:protein involved in polysaccharide export with SLBB domain
MGLSFLPMKVFLLLSAMLLPAMMLSADPEEEGLNGKPEVTVDGMVKNAGPVDFKEGMTVAAAIEKAGGTNEFAYRKGVSIFRGGKRIRINLEDASQRETKLVVRDTIEIPQRIQGR